MNDGIRAKLQDLRDLVEFLEYKSEEIKALIDSASIEDVLIIKQMASIHRQTAYATFETLEDTADNHANKLLK